MLVNVSFKIKKIKEFQRIPSKFRQEASRKPKTYKKEDRNVSKTFLEKKFRINSKLIQLSSFELKSETYKKER
jgi:hypothetical protein